MSRRLATILALSALTLCGLAAPGASRAAAVDGDGMWIWYVSKSSGGTANGIAAKAARNNVKTVYIKSADGTSRWTQFNRPLVQALKARGLKVCAWQFVYGRNPKTEADRAAEAARAGADCTVIDAEGHYEGKYVSAQTYMTRLRRKVGPNYEVALTSFPYVHFHPGFPYSVFMGPGGAQANLPQMYWKTIGTSVDTIYRNTWTYNKVYGRPIYPLGQTYSNPSAADVRRFRLLAGTYGAKGLSWWVWQFSGARQWTALGSPFSPFGTPVRRDTYPAAQARLPLGPGGLAPAAPDEGRPAAHRERQLRQRHRDRGARLPDLARALRQRPHGPADVAGPAARRTRRREVGPEADRDPGDRGRRPPRVGPAGAAERLARRAPQRAGGRPRALAVGQRLDAAADEGHGVVDHLRGGGLELLRRPSPWPCLPMASSAAMVAAPTMCGTSASSATPRSTATAPATIRSARSCSPRS